MCVDPSWQKDFGAKELLNAGRGRCVNAQVFSFWLGIALAIGEVRKRVEEDSHYKTLIDHGVVIPDY